MKKRILVTGANGYIGRHVVEYLLDKGHVVIAADINTSEIDDRAEKTTADIFSGDEQIFDEIGRPDICIHLAWRNGFVHNSDSHIIDLPKHYLFIKHMVEGGLKQLVVMGSMHEVGYWEGVIDENTPTNPESMYGIAKNTLRQLSYNICKQSNAVWQWTRGYYIIGDDLKNNSIFSKLTKAANEGKKTFPFTTGKNKYDFISIDELAKQISEVALQTEVDGIINCCTGKPVSLADRVEQFIKDNKFDIKLEYGAFPDRPYDSPAEWGDNKKIDSILMNSK